MYLNSLLLALGLILVSCKTPDTNSSLNEASQVDRNLIDQDPQEYSYLLSLESGCVGFIIDSQKKIGMTADRCMPKAGSRICHGASSSLWAVSSESASHCPHPGRVVSQLEVSTIGVLDYVVFEFELETRGQTFKLSELKLAGQDFTYELLSRESYIEVVGYPLRDNNTANLTSHLCRVKTKVDHGLEYKTFSDIMIKYWELGKYPDWVSEENRSKKKPLATSLNQRYLKMRQSCQSLVNQNPFSFLSFTSDCQVSTGNIGSPLIYKGVVVGMPRTFQPPKKYDVQTDPSQVCYQYLDPFFSSLKGNSFKTMNFQAIWYDYDRGDVTYSKPPSHTPMHILVRQSPFFQNHPQYISRNLEIESDANLLWQDASILKGRKIAPLSNEEVKLSDKALIEFRKKQHTRSKEYLLHSRSKYYKP